MRALSFGLLARSDAAESGPLALPPGTYISVHLPQVSYSTPVGTRRYGLAGAAAAVSQDTKIAIDSGTRAAITLPGQGRG